jgi:hypothetical protein
MNTKLKRYIEAANAEWEAYRAAMNAAQGSISHQKKREAHQLAKEALDSIRAELGNDPEIRKCLPPSMRATGINGALRGTIQERVFVGKIPVTITGHYYGPSNGSHAWGHAMLERVTVV